MTVRSINANGFRYHDAALAASAKHLRNSSFDTVPPQISAPPQLIRRVGGNSFTATTIGKPVLQILDMFFRLPAPRTSRHIFAAQVDAATAVHLQRPHRRDQRPPPVETALRHLISRDFPRQIGASRLRSYKHRPVQSIRVAVGLLQPWAILASRPPWMIADFNVCTMFG